MKSGNNPYYDYSLRRRDLFRLAGAGLLGSSAARVSAQYRRPRPLKRPNIIFILADDLGYGDLGCFGGSLPTPNIDRLAQSGVRFTNLHSGGPVCTASRATLLTGRYCQRLGKTALDMVLFPGDSEGLDRTTTIADLLRYQGYQTACIGKWHLGDHPAYWPTAHGFDIFRGTPYSVDMAPLPYYHNAELVDTFENKRQLLAGQITKDAVEFLEESSGRLREPFFLYVAQTAVHTPILPSPQFDGRSGKGPYGDVVLELDDCVGQIAAAAPANTLIIVSSDNGAPVDPHTAPQWQGSNGPLSGTKFTTQEGGLRIPGIGYWPGRIQPGVVSGQLASFMDFSKTFGMIAGLDANDPHLSNSDGVNIWPVMSGQANQLQRPLLLYFCYDDPECAAGRYRDSRSGLEYNLKIRFARNGQHLANPELYDMDTDCGETTDIATIHPQIVQQMISDARALLRAFPDNINKSLC